MNMIIDLILIAILVVSAAFAMKKGLVGSLISLLGTLIAIVLSIVLSGMVSTFIDENFVNPSVKKYILTTIDNSAVGKSYDDALNSIDIAKRIEQMPSKLKTALEIAHIDSNEIIKKANDITENSQRAKDDIISAIAKPISKTISQVLSLIILFVVINIALWFAAKLITALLDVIPVGKKFNKAGGLLFGLVRGTLIVFVIAIMFSAFSEGVDPESDNLFSKKTINSTIVLKSAADINPLNMFLQR